jgi:hypothetical protein
MPNWRRSDLPWSRHRPGAACAFFHLTAWSLFEKCSDGLVGLQIEPSNLLQIILTKTFT